MVGKVEFHPKDELVWVYDTKANNDALYVTVTYWDYGLMMPDTATA